MSAVMTETTPPIIKPQTEAVQLYAKIKRASEHSHQHKGQPFPVELMESRGFWNPANPKGIYCVHGNNNDYRIADLRFYVKLGERFVALS